MVNFEELIQGYRRFRNTGWTAQRERWSELSTGQHPKVLVIACSDSRVDPSQIFDVSPGEIFVVRNVAALVPPFEEDDGFHGVSAALEFAVTQLEVEEIVVMGHGLCGGCHAALSGDFKDAKPGEGGFIGRWIALLDGAREKVRSKFGDDQSMEALHALEFEAVKTSLTNLRTFPFVTKREDGKSLKIFGAWFGIDDGLLHVLNEENGEFPTVS